MEFFNSLKIPERGRALTKVEAMRLAIAVGYYGAGYTSPNPMVGCVILDKENKFLTYGFHRKIGSAHAEIDALNNLKDEEKEGIQIFVTLEPCSHEGRTPSCAKTLCELPIGKIYYGLKDPNPKVSGKGLKILSNSGKEVDPIIELREELEELTEVFHYNMTKKKTFVALKVASSLDGQIALQSGESKWITNEESREWGHFLRGMYDATLIGKATVQTDNPNLNIRHRNFKSKENKIVIMDPSAQTISDIERLKIFEANKRENIFLVTKKENESHVKEAGLNPILIDYRQNGFDISQLLSKLLEIGIGSVLVEGGAATYNSFLNEKLAHRIYLFQAPKIIGAMNGLSWTAGIGISQLSDQIQVAKTRVFQFNDNVLITGRVF